MNIPFINLEAQYRSVKREIDEAIRASLLNFTFLRGKEVDAFEKAFAKILGIGNCISVGNGTDGLFISLKALGIKHGDEVITPAFSWISTAETISLCGAKPVFADVDPQTFTMNVDNVKEKINRNTKAVILVHLYGQAAESAEIKRLCDNHQLRLVEDCAQAHLSGENGKYTGTFSDIASFSFYPTKNLGAYGDAGCIVTHDDALAQYMRRYTNHGALEKDDHLIEGTNSRMDTLQAAILLSKLPHLKEWNVKRIQNAFLYTSLLKDEKNIVTPYVRPNTTHSFHIYAIRAARRNQLQEYLLKNGIQTLVHYPRALPNLPAYEHLNQRAEDFPVANALQNEILSLPIYPELMQEEITYICQKINSFYHN